MAADRRVNDVGRCMIVNHLACVTVVGRGCGGRKLFTLCLRLAEQSPGAPISSPRGAFVPRLEMGGLGTI